MVGGGRRGVPSNVVFVVVVGGRCVSWLTMWWGECLLVFAVVVGDVLGEVIHRPNCQWEKIWGIV